jgi:hypothetical protein
MDSTIFKYMDFLQRTLDILESMRKNTIEQSYALEREDDVLLGRLLKECDGHIENLAQATRLSMEISIGEKNGEILQKEHAIDSLLQEILHINSDNAKKAEELKNDIAAIIRHLRKCRDFAQKSRIKVPQQFGYYFDKRV